jgi:hypothetical protein
MARGWTNRSRYGAAAPAALLVAVTACWLTACGGDRTGAFQDAGGRSDCRVHQSALPGTPYTGGANGDTEAILAMMRYYTAHESQPYCDGRVATSLDQAWTSLYIQLGGDRAHVAR